MKYAEELTKAMTWLGEQPDTFFLGQAVAYPGTAMTNTLKGVSSDKLWEMPVCEDMQMGMSIGMALDGKTVPISIFPRWNFLLLATNQIVNHLDKIEQMSSNPYKPRVIIRTSVGSERPLHPQHQHVGNYANAFRSMCPNIYVVELIEPENIVQAYKTIYNSNKSAIMIEWGDYYNEK